MELLFVGLQAQVLKGLGRVQRRVGIRLLVSQLDNDTVGGLEQIGGTLLSGGGIVGILNDLGLLGSQVFESGGEGFIF